VTDRSDAPAGAAPADEAGPGDGDGGQVPASGRSFEAEGRTWVVRVAGYGALGTGHYSLGPVEAVHFALADAPDVPVREALLPRGRLDAMFDSELAALLAGATPIVVPDRR
jgi:hypothetical protein